VVIHCDLVVVFEPLEHERVDGFGAENVGREGGKGELVEEAPMAETVDRRVSALEFAGRAPGFVMRVGM